MRKRCQTKNWTECIQMKLCNYCRWRVVQWWKHSPPTHVVGCHAICGLSLVLVLSFALSDFLLGTPVFPSPQNKPTFPNPKLTRNGRQRTLHGCATHCTFKLLFIYLLILLCLWPWFPIGCFFPLELTLLATKLPNICLQCKIMDKNTWQK